MNRTFFVVLFLAFSYNVEAQLNLKYREATIFFRDGTQKKGLGKLAKLGSKIKFKETKKDEPIIYDYRKVSGFTIKYAHENTEYEYKIIEGKTGAKLLRVKERGALNLYYTIAKSGGWSTGPNGVMTYSGGFDTEIYYLGDKDASIVYETQGLIGISKKKFKKLTDKFFSKCAELVKKIKNKEYKKRHIVEIVTYYNSKCK